MKNDGILYNQKFNISHYVDEKLKELSKIGARIVMIGLN